MFSYKFQTLAQGPSSLNGGVFIIKFEQVFVYTYQFPSLRPKIDYWKTTCSVINRTIFTKKEPVLRSFLENLVLRSLYSFQKDDKNEEMIR